MEGTLSKKFHKQTDFNFPIGQPPSDPQYWPKEWKEIYHKEYPRLSRIDLPKELLSLGTTEDVLKERHSTREFDVEKYLTKQELSTILYFSAGVKPTDEKSSKIRRHYPSGGARYPLETYILIQRVEGIEPGIYHYNVKEHSLEKLDNDSECIEKIKDGLYYDWSRKAAAVIFITAVWNRNFMKYKDRGYRIVLMEAGHLAQNIALASAGLKIGCCNSVGFHNQRIDEMLDIENDDEDSLCMAVIGK